MNYEKEIDYIAHCLETKNSDLYWVNTFYVYKDSIDWNVPRDEDYIDVLLFEKADLEEWDAIKINLKKHLQKLNDKKNI